MKTKKKIYDVIHSYTLENKALLQNSECNFCIYCKRTVNFADIVEWLVERSGKDSALCPYCGIDCVVPQRIDDVYDMDEQLLDEMHKYWFE